MEKSRNPARWKAPSLKRRLGWGVPGFFVAALLVALGGCETTGLQNSQRLVSGTVMEAGGEAGVSDAIVSITNLDEQHIAQTDSAGTYTFEVSVESTTELEIVATKTGYRPDTVQVQVYTSADDDIVAPDLRLAVIQTARTGPKNVVLAGVEAEEIVVTESGGIESTDITYAVVDSTGAPIDLGSAVEVTFRFGARPGGGEELYPMAATTGADGRVSTTLHSGTIAGVVQVVAEISHGSSTIRSQPVSIAIHGGLPDQEHFGVGPTTFNVPFVTFGIQDTINAFVGDKYGNIVEPGTRVYFSTTGGMIEGSAVTDEQGRASVLLITNNPYPDAHPVYGPGYATITARTADENGQTISTEATVLMSRESSISDLAPSTVDIPNGGSQTITFTVSDTHGNPLTVGTTVSVSTASDAVELTGDTEVSLEDGLFGGPGITEFSVTATDADPTVAESNPVEILILVSGPNRTASATVTGTVN